MAKRKRKLTDEERAERKAERAAKRAEMDAKRPSEVPEFRDAAGFLLKLKPYDFPKGVAGAQSYCDYNIEKWKERRERAAIANDPNSKAKKKLEMYRRKAAELEAELAALEAAAE